MESPKRFLFPDFGLSVLVRLPVSAKASHGQLVSGHVTEGDVNETNSPRRPWKAQHWN